MSQSIDDYTKNSDEVIHTEYQLTTTKEKHNPLFEADGNTESIIEHLVKPENEEDTGKTEIIEEDLEPKVNERESELDVAFNKILKRQESKGYRSSKLYDEIDISPRKYESNWELKEEPVVLRRKPAPEAPPPPYPADENRVMEVYGIGKRKSDKIEDIELNDLAPSPEDIEQRNKIIRVKRESTINHPKYLHCTDDFIIHVQHILAG